MFKKKQINKLSVNLVDLSFKQGKLIEGKVGEIIKGIKKLPVADAGNLLVAYYNGLKREIAKKTIIIESLDQLNKQELEKIKSGFLGKYKGYEIVQVKNNLLIGGLRIRIGDLIIGSSLKNNINQIKGAILS